MGGKEFRGSLASLVEEMAVAGWRLRRAWFREAHLLEDEWTT
jgi:hypothetical protein